MLTPAPPACAPLIAHRSPCTVGARPPVAARPGGIRVHTVLVVVLDTATPAVTAAVAAVTGTVEILAERVAVDPRAHGELLAPQIDAVLREVGVRPRDLAAAAARGGPRPVPRLRGGLGAAPAPAPPLGPPRDGGGPPE